MAHKHLDLHAVARLIGEDDTKNARRRIRRAIRARECQIEEKIFLPGNRKCLTTIPLLRRHMPEWFDRRDRDAEILRKTFESLTERVRLLEQKVGALSSRYRSMNKRMMDLEAPG